VATVPALGRGYADNSDTGDVTVFDLRTLRPIGKIAADADSDAMLYDSATGFLVVANGDSHSASIIDVRSSKRLANVPLGGSPEMMAPDREGKVFINVASANQVVRLDLRSRAIDARWSTPGCESPHGLAIDAATRRLFLSCANARMLVMDATNGKSLALLPIGSGTDGAAFDPVRRWAFSSNRDGTLSVVAERTRKRFVALGNVGTAPGARTMAINPRTGRIFLVTAAVSGERPPKTPGGSREDVFAPGTVKLMMFDPQ
jgi:YVTN family beta-propeller protein